jgi:hypothetical protein
VLLSDAGVLLHARVRPEGGLDIASLVPRDSQADQLFHLKSGLFAGAVLDGTWEIAVYPPEAGGAVPPAALAIGTSLRSPAVAAMEDFLAEITAAWPVQRRDFALGDAEGACLPDLNLLPELAPCYVATDAALVVGWNAASLRRALAQGAGGAVDPRNPAAELHVDLARMALADRRLAGEGGAREGAPGALPWRRLVADGETEGDAVRLRVELSGGAGA